MTHRIDRYRLPRLELANELSRPSQEPVARMDLARIAIAWLFRPGLCGPAGIWRVRHPHWMGQHGRRHPGRPSSARLQPRRDGRLFHPGKCSGIDGSSTSNIDDSSRPMILMAHPLRFRFHSRTPRVSHHGGCGRRTPSVSSRGSVVSYLYHFMLTCGFTFR